MKRVGAKQTVHWFLARKGLGIQQETGVWVGSPKSNKDHITSNIVEIMVLGFN